MSSRSLAWAALQLHPASFLTTGGCLQQLLMTAGVDRYYQIVRQALVSVQGTS